MFSDLLVFAQEALTRLGLSTQLLMTVVAVIGVLLALMLSGQTARIGVWAEDLAYRLGRSNR